MKGDEKESHHPCFENVKNSDKRNLQNLLTHRSLKNTKKYGNCDLKRNFC
jgi:hypothetical protein